MERTSLLNHGFPPELNGHYQDGYGGAIMPVHITSHHRYNSTSRKKNNLRLNDELVPKPIDINIRDKMIATAIPKEHPYSSHISRFAMFPSFRSPDDPHTGVRAATQPFLNHLIPNSAPDVTVLSKTIGGPYRHEILKPTRKKAVMWPGAHGFLDHTKPLMGEKQVFYPTPPKTVLRPAGLPVIHPEDRVGTVGREGAALSLLDLQNSFTMSEAHRNFNSSITRAAVNLRDNVVTGKKHDFYGVNCYYLHG